MKSGGRNVYGAGKWWNICKFVNMAAPAGNDFYKQVKAPTGRPKKYESAQDLWLKAVEYFDWVQDNPLYELRIFQYQGEIVEKEMPKMRAMTEVAFCLFADISMDTFQNYKKSNPEQIEDFFGVSKKIAAIIYGQKFEGAAADFLNANIIGRELGLVDKNQTALTDPDGNALPLSNDQVDKILSAIRETNKGKEMQHEG